MRGVLVSACPSCGWQGFPRRLWCPSCGAEALDEAEIRGGRVEVATVLHRVTGRELDAVVPLGAVMLDGGGRAVVRLVGAAPGDRVAVSIEAGALVGRRER